MERLQTGQMIEWKDLDKRKFYVIGPGLFMFVRSLIYPFNLIKTRLFMQQRKSYYSGTADAFYKVVRGEGFRGLYKGFLFSSLGMVSGQMYLTTYEMTRSYLSGYRSEVRGLVAGGTATLVGQSVTVPIDIVTQIMMMQGQAAGGVGSSKLKPRDYYIVVKNADYIIPHKKTVKLRGAVSIVNEIIRKEGLRGLYRGYHVSLLTYAPSSALWWAFYAGFYRRVMELGLFPGAPIPLVQACCGVCSGLLVSIITNPLDVVRTRYQVCC
jgi:solute carrier family 25 protein 44